MSEPSYEHHPIDDIEPEQRPELMAALQLYFRRVFIWMHGGTTDPQKWLRFDVFSMIVFPDVQHRTGETIAKAHGITRQAVNKLENEFRDIYALRENHIQNRAMRNNSTREKCRKSQLKRNREPKLSSQSKTSMSRLKRLRMQQAGAP